VGVRHVRCIHLRGTTHLMAIRNIWRPVYWLDASIKVATAAASLATAIMLWPPIPRTLSFPSARQLEESNRRLQIEIAERRRIQSQLQEFNHLQQQRVTERTAELHTANAELRRQIDEPSQVDQLLRERQQPLQAVADHSTDIIWAKDLEGPYLLVNGRYKRCAPRTLATLSKSGLR
jgi:two-component system sensor histidine kinase UhpB